MHMTSSVPFAWEIHPGIPKHGEPRYSTTPAHPHALPLPLPLPPHLGSRPSKNRPAKQHRTRSLAKDPFAVAFMECSNEEEEVPQSSSSWKRAVRKWIGKRPLDLLYGSCRSRQSVADSIVPAKAANMVSSYDLLQRRVG